MIHIYEADYNLILGVKWRELLHHAAKHGLLNRHQFGSVPGRSAIDLCYMEELEYEVSKCCLHPMIKNDNDAASCYDRILMYIASLASRKRGMPVNVCKVNGMNLEQAKILHQNKARHLRHIPSTHRGVPMAWFRPGSGEFTNTVAVHLQHTVRLL